MSDAEPTLRLRTGSTAWREVDGETILLDLESSEYVGVNVSGTALWHLLDGGTTRGQLVEELVSHFEVPPVDARRDVDAFLDACRARNLIES